MLQDVSRFLITINYISGFPVRYGGESGDAVHMKHWNGEQLNLGNYFCFVMFAIFCLF